MPRHLHPVISLLATVLPATLLCLSSTAFATNGYFAHGYSSKEKALAGSGVAHGQDAMAIANNPAGLAFIEERLDAGINFFSPERSYSTSGTAPAPEGTPVSAFCSGANPTVCQAPFTVGSGGESIDSVNELFLIPHVAYNWRISADAALALALYANGGMNTEYRLSENPSATGLAPNPSPTGPGDAYTIQTLSGALGAGKAGVDLAQLFLNISYAQKINDTSSWGAGIILAYQRFRATGLAGFAGFSNDPNNLTNSSGHDSAEGVGARLGWQGKITPSLTLGASYQSRIYMNEFDDYAGLYAEQGDFDIPSTVSVGLAWDVRENSKLLMDIQTIFYSEVEAVANSISQLSNGSCVDALNSAINSGPQAASGRGCLGGANGAGFGWEDMTIIKLGYQWGDDTQWRAGISHGSNPIPKDEVLFNILAPGVMETHLTFGFTVPLDAHSEITFAAMHALKNDVTAANPFDGGATTIELEMEQNEAQLSYSKKF